MITALRTVHLVALWLGLLVVFGRLADWLAGLGAHTVREAPEGCLRLAGTVVLLSITYCATFGFGRCSRKATLMLYVLWIGIFTWYGWFSDYVALFRLHELHTLDPVEAEAEARRFFHRAMATYVALLGIFSIHPILVFSMRRTLPESRANQAFHHDARLSPA